MARELNSGECWLLNWNPSKRPEHQEMFDQIEIRLANGQTPNLVPWICTINTQKAGDPVLIKRGASSKYSGICATGTVFEDRDGDDTVTVDIDFVAPLGNEYSLSKIRELDPAILRLFATGHAVGSKTASAIHKWFGFPQKQIADSKPQFEGGIRETRQSRRERSRKARTACLEHFGDEICRCCNINFVERYGEMGRILHCHHREDLALKGVSSIDGVTDMVPVCPNCHAMLHFTKPAMSVNSLAKLVSEDAAQQLATPNPALAGAFEMDELSPPPVDR